MYHLARTKFFGDRALVKSLISHVGYLGGYWIPVNLSKCLWIVEKFEEQLASQEELTNWNITAINTSLIYIALFVWMIAMIPPLQFQN
jgi:GTP cyclohydrolase I